MKNSTLGIIVVAMLLSVSLALAQGKGKGDLGASDTFPASFDMAGCSGETPCITGDRIYEHGVDHVVAEFVAAGNPILDLRDRKSTRVTEIIWGSCEPTGEGIVPEFPQIRLNHSQLVDEMGVLIDDRFLGMAEGQVAYSRLGISFGTGEKNAEGWSIRFSDAMEFDGTSGSRVQVTRAGRTHWEVSTTHDDGIKATAIIGRVSKGAFRAIGACSFQLDITILCPDCPAAP